MKKSEPSIRLEIFFALGLLLLGGFSAPAQDEGFPCDDRLYLSKLTTQTSGNIRALRLDSAGVHILPPTDLDIALIGVGYRVADKLIYGIERFNKHIYRVYPDGRVDDLGIPQNFNPAYEFYSGGMSPNGRTLFLIGHDPESGRDKELYSINLDSEPLYAGRVAILSDQPRHIEDFAFDPTTGTVYAYDSRFRTLVNMTLFNGLITNVGFQDLPNVPPFGALFFDSAGELFAFGKHTNSLFRLDKRSGAILEKLKGPGGDHADGCSCPYRLRLEKEAQPPEVFPCGQTTIVYRLFNSAGRAYSNLDFRDSFPPEFTITEIVHKPNFGKIESGVGSNVLHLSFFTSILGKDSIVIRVDVGDYAADVQKSAARLSPLPLALGAFADSDDPKSRTPQDPTAIRVLHGAEIFPDSVLEFCPETPLLLEAPDDGSTFQWSTGETGSAIYVETPGTYWVEATGICGVYRDTVRVQERSEPLTLDLGPDRTVLLGESLTLSAASNGEGLQYRWESTPPGLLSCTSCPNPRLEPLDSVRIRLRITDALGCSAEDELLVRVEPKRQVFAPNVFSPDGDGINDAFFLQGLPGTRVLQLRVFDRWGGLLFEGSGAVNDPAFGWKGRAKNGREAPVGVYLWWAEVEFADGARKTLTGDVLLIR